MRTRSAPNQGRLESQEVQVPAKSAPGPAPSVPDEAGRGTAQAQSARPGCYLGNDPWGAGRASGPGAGSQNHTRGALASLLSAAGCLRTVSPASKFIHGYPYRLWLQCGWMETSRSCSGVHFLYVLLG